MLMSEWRMESDRSPIDRHPHDAEVMHRVDAAAFSHHTAQRVLSSRIAVTERIYYSSVQLSKSFYF